MATLRLHLIDSAKATDRDAARKLIDGPAPKRPSAAIAAVLGTLADLSASLWPEGLQEDATTPVVEIDADATLLTPEMLGRIRAIAHSHGVHVYDEEGHVLYRADGTEFSDETIAASLPADPIEALRGQLVSPQGIRYDGVYRALKPTETRSVVTRSQWSHLLFHPDGDMAWGNSSPEPVLELMKYFMAGGAYVASGKLKVAKSGEISYRVRAGFGSFKGTIEVRPNGNLFTRQARSDGRYAVEIEYEFVAAGG